jgi:hypothetical protein
MREEQNINSRAAEVSLYNKKKNPELNRQIAYFLSTQTFGTLKNSKLYKYHAYMIYTNKGMLLDMVLCNLIPCVCPLIDHGSRPMKALEFFTLLCLTIIRGE